jgi:hypothetical protein
MENGPVSVEQVVEIYNEVVGGILPVVKTINKKRRGAISQRIKEDPDRKTAVWWRGFFQYVVARPFLCGDNNRNWRADFDWLTGPENIVKTVEGRYEGLGNSEKKPEGGKNEQLAAALIKTGAYDAEIRHCQGRVEQNFNYAGSSVGGERTNGLCDGSEERHAGRDDGSRIYPLPEDS